ncbi:UvrB/UvrC motif-containing protein [Kushneria phosphatilytica]
MTLDDVNREIRRLEDEMHEAAKNLEFETAAQLRDEMQTLNARLIELK